MSNVLIAAYPWIKALHLVAVVSWMAGLFYLPRLFVYHAERGAPGSEMSETFKVMERRLLRLHHASGDDRDLGARADAGADARASSAGRRRAGSTSSWRPSWGCRGSTNGWRGAARTSRRTGTGVSGRTYRLANEVPTLALFVIAIMVIVKPF